VAVNLKKATGPKRQNRLRFKSIIMSIAFPYK